MTTFANRARQRDRSVHQDLLDQVASCADERENVRRILSEELLPDDPQQAWKERPFAIGATNHVHRMLPREEPERPPLRAGDLFKVCALILASWAAVAFVLLVMGVRL